MSKIDYANDLIGRICICGEPKRVGQSFCRGCYYQLFWTQRRALWQLIGDGYEAAYDEAARYLNSIHGRTGGTSRNA